LVHRHREFRRWTFSRYEIRKTEVLAEGIIAVAAQGSQHGD